MAKTRILTVCLGNICRSPLAKGILDSLVDPREVIVDSAGTGDYHIGDPPDERSVEVAKKNGLDITDQRGRQFTASDLVEYDHILAMDNYNYEDIVALASDEKDKEKVKLILNYAIPGENLDVPDPYFGGMSGFDDVYDMLKKACRNFVDKELKNG